jgi:hypothetical protein
MQTIGIGELQKNMGILTHLTEALTIIDKRKNKSVAVVYPIVEENCRTVDEIAGSLSRYTNIKIDDLDKAKEEAMMEAMKEKYGFTD